MGEAGWQGNTWGLYPAPGNWAFNLGSYEFNDPTAPLDLDQNHSDRLVGTGVDIGALESDALFIGRFEDPPMFYVIGEPPGG